MNKLTQICALKARLWRPSKGQITTHTAVLLLAHRRMHFGECRFCIWIAYMTSCIAKLGLHASPSCFMVILCGWRAVPLLCLSIKYSDILKASLPLVPPVSNNKCACYKPFYKLREREQRIWIACKIFCSQKSQTA